MAPLSDELGDEDWPEEYRHLDTSRMFGRSRWFRPTRAGDYKLTLPDDLRQVVGRMVADLRELVLVGDDSLRRLYPTAYPEDAARDEEFAAFAHDQLLMARLEAYDTVERTLDADRLDEAALNAWMRTVNEARLVLGTRLDVSEDDPREDDPAHPDAPALALYHVLGRLVGDMVDALHGSLPPPED